MAFMEVFRICSGWLKNQKQSEAKAKFTISSSYSERHKNTQWLSSAHHHQRAGLVWGHWKWFKINPHTPEDIHHEEVSIEKKARPSITHFSSSGEQTAVGS